MNLLKPASLLAFLFIITYVFAQSQSFMHEFKTYGGSLDDRGFEIIQTSDGGYIAAGSSESDDIDVSENNGLEDFWIVKLNQELDVQWQTSLGGSKQDVAHSIRQTSDDGYIVAGYTSSEDGDITNNHGDSDAWIVKLNENGEMQWQKCYGGSEPDKAMEIELTDDGGYVFAGYTSSNDGDVTGHHGLHDYWIVKLNDNGDLIWQNSLGGSLLDKCESIDITSDGDYVLAGRTRSTDGDVTNHHGDDDAWVVKVNNLGEILWQKTLGGSDSDNANIIKYTASDNGYIIGGYAESNDGDLADVNNNYNQQGYWIVKLDEQCNIEWQKCNTGGWSSRGITNIISCEENGYIAIGYESSWTSLNNDIHIKRLTDSGTLKGSVNFGGSNDEKVYGVIEKSLDNFIIGGYTSSDDGSFNGTNGEGDFLIVDLVFCPERTISIQIADTNYCYSTELIATEGFDSYLWSDGSEQKIIEVWGDGDYQVTGYDYNGCSYESKEVYPNPIEPNDLNICMLTYDDETGKNKILYNPVKNKGIDSVFLYRRDDTSYYGENYRKIDANGIDEKGVFIDHQSTPKYFTDFYKIAVLDTCGKIGDLSDYHHSLRLEAEKENENIILSWHSYYHYGVNEYSDFEIYRSIDDGKDSLIGEDSSYPYSYTDTNPPPGNKQYHLRVKKESPCTFNGDSVQYAYSHKISTNELGAPSKSPILEIRVYPNPVKKKLRIEIAELKNDLVAELIDPYGRVIDKFSFDSFTKEKTISLKGLACGIYYLRFDNSQVKKLIKK